VNASLLFTHHWDGTPIQNSDFETTLFTNANGEQLDISRLSYLIPNVTFTDADGNAFTAGHYNLVDVREGTGFSYQPDLNFPAGTYTVSFRFGFNDEDNVSGAYVDLSSVSWDVPEPMGGGYHYMQMDGTYINTEGEVMPYNFHTIRAVVPDMPNPPIELTDTSFEVVLGQYNLQLNNGIIEVQMDVSEWFKNPNQWDLNELDTPLMPNYDAQIMMMENGEAGVFGPVE